MSGLSSGIGLFSGIDTGSLISQLLAAQSRPKVLAQQRVVQLQTQQTALMDLNSRLGALKTAAAKFNVAKIFQAATASTSDADALTATARPGAAPGAYAFIVDRVVSTQQLLSRGFADSTSSGMDATSFTFEPTHGRLDRDTSLSEINGGAGLVRGKIRITDSTGASGVIDLSRVASVSEVLDLINTSSDVRVTASVSGGRLVIDDRAGGAGTMAIANDTGSTTATSLGITGSAAAAGAGRLTGGNLYYIGGATTLQSLNDGNGVRISEASGTSTPDLVITARDGASFNIDIGSTHELVDGVLTQTAGAVSTIQGVIERINTQSGGSVTASVAPDGVSLRLVDNTAGAGSFVVANIGTSSTATDLGIATAVPGGTITGGRVMAGLNSTLASNLLGGDGLGSGAMSVTARDGTSYNFTVPTSGSVTDIMEAIGAATGGRVTASLDDTGTGLRLTDSTGSTASNLIVSGAGATALGVSTVPAGVDATTMGGERLQHRYIAASTRLATLSGGAGVGKGTIEMVDSRGTVSTITLGDDQKTIGDLLELINSRPSRIKARINENGDGVELFEEALDAGSLKITVRDTSGTAGKNLNLVGEAAEAGAAGTINGSFEKKVTFDAADTLSEVAQKINDAAVGVSATIINDGSGASPFRLSLTSRKTGTGGAFTFDSGGVDMGVQTLSSGRDARLFYGSTNPATAVLLTSTTNTFDGVIDGLSIDAKSPSDEPVTVTVGRDTATIEKAITDMVTGFNDIVSRIDLLTDYNSETQRKGALFGDSSVQQLRSNLFSTMQRKAVGISGSFETLTEVGIKFAAGGKVELNAERLREALNQDPQGVADVFAAKVQNSREPIELAPGITVNNTDPDSFSSLGVAEQLVQILDKYVNSTTGVFKTRRDTIDGQIKFQNQRIEDFDDRLQQRRGVLERQFLAMERAIGQLQSQQGAIGQIGIR
ncbi:MAG: flagellar filament capping protein FliD [Phycisphaerales bacterium]|nr:flagellar filament capping protein FliD [Phycisphaerales bacterium]